jgi:hypothetical protein
MNFVAISAPRNLQEPDACCTSVHTAEGLCSRYLKDTVSILAEND